MSVIIRLQNLPWSANALDIRQFFNGLSIPEGGVHIVGGELGDAFIAFSTDEDARQAFNLNGGKLKEVQIKLMLSSRTEMQKVIEAARTPLAAFMQAVPVPQPLPAMIPAAIPAIVPEITKKEDFNKDKDKRDRRRSRSRSRDRKERSRDRDRDRRDNRRRRDRSRSRSRDRRDRRRRDRSHSRERRSKDRDRRSKDRRQSEDKAPSSSNSSTDNAQKGQTKMGIWEDPVRSVASPAMQHAQAILNSFIPNNLEEARRNLNALAPTPTPLIMGNRNGFQNQSDTFPLNRGRENWSNNGPTRQGDGRHDFASRFNRTVPATRNDDNKFNVNPSRGPLNNPTFGDNSRMNFNRPNRTDSRNSRFDNPSERPGLLERPGHLDRSSMPDRTHVDFLKNSCVQLRPYYGGYGEVRRFFHGIFINNTGIKFINDDKGKRTGIVYIRFATPEGKEKAVLRNGGQLKNQIVEINHLDDDVFEKTVDRYQPEFDNEQDHSSSERPLFKHKNSPVFTKHVSQFSCLAVEDLPLFTKEQDMLKIFSDYPLLSILLVNKQRHIIAYIKFNDPEDAKKAQTEKSKHVFDGKPLNIRPCPDEEFAIISHEEPEEADEVIEVEDDEDNTYVTSDCVSLSGLPLKTTDRDVSDFFSDVAIVPSKIHLINSNLGFTGLAYCEFASIADAEIALEKNGLPLGSGVVTVDSVTRSEMESKIGIKSVSLMSLNRPQNLIRPPFFPRGFGRGGPRGMGLMGHRPPMRRFPMHPPPVDPSEMALPGFTVRMENVPYKAALDEILDFFDGFDIPADNVLRRYNENGTPSGEAKVIFKSSKDAFQAVQQRHLCKIRERTVFLHQC